MRVKQYKLLSHCSPDDLTQAVNREIQDGAIPYGNPYHSGRCHTQAVVYPEPPSSTIDREYSP